MPNPEHRLAELTRGATTEQAVEFLDGLAPVRVAEMLGTWHGSELPTAHPLDGLLGAYGWRGKRIDGPDAVHPLLVGSGPGAFSVNPAAIPVRLLVRIPWLLRQPPVAAAGRAVAKLARTGRPAARLRMMEYRGVVTATISYDALPLHDHFRRVSADTLLGAVDLRGVDRPFFFVLRREKAGGS